MMLSTAPTRSSRAARLLAVAASSALPSVLGFCSHSALADTPATWDSGNGNWSDPTQWTPNTVPDNAGSNLFDVTVSGGSINLDINPTIQQLSISGGTITGTGTLTINDTFGWTGGAIGSTGSSQTINADGGMSIANGVSFSGGTINNSGTAAWNSGSIYASGTDQPGQNTTFNNNAGATFTIECDQRYYGNAIIYTAPDQFNNYGTIIKSGTTGETEIDAQFNNSGTVSVQSGVFSLNGGGNESGAFTVASGAAFQVDANGTTTFSSSSSIAGPGNVNFVYGTTAIDGGFSPTGVVTVSGGSVSFNSPQGATSGTLNIYNGAVALASGATLTPSGLYIGSGQVTGAGTLTTSGLFTWDGGTVGSAGSSQTINANGGMNIANGVSFSGGTINNSGTAAWNSGSIYASGTDQPGQNTTFNNNAGATFTIECDQRYYGNAIIYTAPDQFNNYGTIIKSGTTGETEIDAQFNNSGTVSVQSGVFSLNGGGNESGAFTIASGAAFQVDANGTTTFSSSSSIAGPGNVNFVYGTTAIDGGFSPTGVVTVSGGSVSFNSPQGATSGTLNIYNGAVALASGATLTPSGLYIGSGQVTGAGTLTTSGLFTWDGGTVGSAGSSQTINANGGMNIANGVSFSGGTINNSGTAAWNSGSIYASGTDQPGQNTTFNNNAGATFTIECDQRYYGNAIIYTAPDQFNNYGTIIKSGTTGETEIDAQFNNSGTVSVQSGVFSLNGGGNESGAFTIASGAAFQVDANGTTTFSSSSSISGQGNVNFVLGTTAINGGFSPGGTTTISSGNVTFTNAAGASLGALSISGGDLTGTSTTLAVNGLFTWTGGTIGSSGSSQTINANGGMNILGGGSYGASVQGGFQGGTINNNGTADFASENSGSPAINFNGGMFNNDGSFIADSGSGNEVLFNNLGGANAFNNSGTFTNQGTGNTLVYVPFNNSGTVDIDAGTLILAGGGTHSGTFAIAGGATLQISGGAAFGPSSSVGGDGNLEFTGPGNPITVNGGTFTAASIYFINGADVIVNSNTAFSNATIGNGPTIDGSGNVTLNGASTWFSGLMQGSGTTTIPAGAAVDIYGGEIARTIENDGAATLGSAATLYFNGGTFNNNGIVTLGDATNGWSYLEFAPYSGTPTALFNNSGTLLVQGGNLGWVQIPFNNSGTVNVNSGTLELTDGGTQTGTFIVAGGATLQLGGPHSLSAASQISGAGNFTVTSDNNPSTSISDAGSVNITGGANFTNSSSTFTGSFAAGSLTIGSDGYAAFNTATAAAIGSGTSSISGGYLDGSANVIIAGDLDWSGGYMQGSGMTTIASGASLNLEAGPNNGFLYRTLENDGTAYFAGTYFGMYFNGGTFNNNGNFTADTTSGPGLYFNNQGGSNAFNNAGTFTTEGSGQAYVNISFNNSGTVNIRGGTLQLGAGGTQSGTFAVASGATLIITGSPEANPTFTSASIVSGQGNVAFSTTTTVNGTYDVAGTTTVSSAFVNFASPNVDITGPLDISSGGTVQFAYGSANINPSSIAVASSSLVNSGLVSTNSVTVSSGGTVTLSAGSLNCQQSLAVGTSGSGGLSQTGGATTIGTLAAGNTGTLTSGNGSGTISISGGSLYADTVLLGSSASGSGDMTVSGSASVTVGGGAHLNDLTVSSGTFTVLNQAPPPGEDPELNRAIVGGYLTNGALNVSGSGVVSSPLLKLGITAGDTGTLTQSGGSITLSTLSVGNDGTLTSGSGTGVANISGGSLYADTVLLGSTAGGSGAMTVSGSGNVTVGGGAHLNDLTVSGGTFTVLAQTPPAGEDPLLNYAIVGGYLTNGALNVSGTGVVSSPMLKLGVSQGNTGTLTQTGGSISLNTLGVGNNGTLTSGSGTGVANISGGSLYADTVLLGSTAGGSGAMTVSGSGNVTVAGGAHLNDLTVSGGTFTVQDGTPPAGEDPELADAIVGGYLTNGALNVSGTGVVSSPLLKLGITSGDTGTLSQSGGSITLSTLSVGNDGTLTSGSGTGVANISGGSLYADTILLGSTAGGSGAMTVSGSGNVTVGGGAHLNDLTMNGGAFTVLDQDPIGSEDPVLYRSIVGGYLSDGALYLNAGAVSTPNLKLGIDHQGTFVQNGGTISITTNLLANQGANSIVTLNGGYMNLYAASIATGSPLVVGDGTHPYTLNLTGGTVTAANGLTISSSGSLTGNGTINGNVSSSGTVSPGNSPGTINITGNFTSTGVLQLQLASATSFDQINVTGSLTLAGTIDLSSLNGYVPVPGATFQLFTDGALVNSGVTFDLTGLSLPAGETLDTSNLLTTGGFSVTPEPGSLSLLVGIFSLLGRRRRRLRAAANTARK